MCLETPAYNFPEKVHLSGADCFHLVLDKHAKKHQAGGNVMRKVFYFDKTPDAEKIRDIFRRSPLVHWMCNIRLNAGSLLTIPYWRYTNGQREIIVRVHQYNIDRAIPPSILSEDIPINAERFVRCDLITYPEGNGALVLSWNHILMDGKGNALFIKHLDDLSRNQLIDPSIFFPAIEPRPNVLKYIINMYQVKKFVQDSSKAPISSIANSTGKSEAAIQYRFISFSVDETEKITANASRAGARFGNTLFYIACCSHAVNALNKRNNKKGVIWLPVPYDGRLRGANGPVISNRVAFLFYRILQADLAEISHTVKSLARQMAWQIQKKKPQKYTMFLNMMRHFPLAIYYLFISYTGRGVFASFLYTSTGENINDINELFGQPVKDIIILPALTIPPGLTFIFLKHNNAMKINVAFTPDMISEIELIEMEQQLRQLLLSETA